MLNENSITPQDGWEGKMLVFFLKNVYIVYFTQWGPKTHLLGLGKRNHIIESNNLMLLHLGVRRDFR